MDSDLCEHCEDDLIDSADHTLRECEAWATERGRLREVIGDDLSLGSVAESRTSWQALARFAREVMLRKEAWERERQRSPRNRIVPSPSTSEADEAAAGSNT